MRLAVVGSRGFQDYDRLCQGIAKLGESVERIVSGGARGADSLAARFARENNIELVEFLPEYDKYGRSAPIIRNKLIVDNADCVIAFWDSESRGTKNSIDYARRQGKKVVVELF